MDWCKSVLHWEMVNLLLQSEVLLSVSEQQNLRPCNPNHPHCRADPRKKKRSPEKKAIMQFNITYIQVSGTLNNVKELEEFHLLLYNTLAAGWRGQKKAECSSAHGVCIRQRKCGRLAQTEAGRHEARERQRAKELMCLILMLDLGHDCQKSGNIFLVSFLWLQHWMTIRHINCPCF